MRRTAVCLLLAGALLLHAGSVHAHAVLVGSFPVSGARLDEAPRSVRIWFSEQITAEFVPLIVRDSSGARVDAGDGQVDPLDPYAVTVGLNPLPTGFYTATYRITSADGHPVQGQIGFTVGDAVPTDAPVPVQEATGVPPSVSLARGLSLLTAILLSGLTAFFVLVWPAVPGAPGPAGLVRWGALLAALFALLGLAETALYAVRASGEPLSASLIGQGLFATRTGRLWLVRVLLTAPAIAALAYSVRLREHWGRWLLLLPGPALLLTFSLQSHAAATRETLPVVMDWVHVVAGAPWVGGVFGFAALGLTTLRRMDAPVRDRLLQSAVPRFSRVAFGSLLLLSATGIYSALLHIDSWESLVATAYGQALLWKLGALVPVLALGAYHLFRQGRGPFRRTVLVEAMLLVGLFVAVGFLTTVPPAKAEMWSRQEGFQQQATVNGLTIDLRVEPARIGANQYTIGLKRADGTPEQGAGVALIASMVVHEMGEQNLTAKESAPGQYSGGELLFGMDGEWRATVAVLTGQGREVRHTFTINIHPLMGQ